MASERPASRPGPAFPETCAEPRRGARETKPQPKPGSQAALRPRDSARPVCLGPRPGLQAVPLTLFTVPVTLPARSPPTFPSGVQGSPPVTSLQPRLWPEAAGGFRESFYSQAGEHSPAEPPEPSRQHASPAAAASARPAGLRGRLGPSWVTPAGPARQAGARGHCRGHRGSASAVPTAQTAGEERGRLRKGLRPQGLGHPSRGGGRTDRTQSKRKGQTPPQGGVSPPWGLHPIAPTLGNSLRETGPLSAALRPPAPSRPSRSSSASGPPAPSLLGSPGRGSW